MREWTERWRERVDERLGDPIWWNDVLQLAKTVLAAVAAWVIAASVLDLPQLVSAYRDLASSWMDAKRAQVEALNATSFSLDEYRWVRSQVYAAAGIPIMEIDVAQIVDDVKAGRTPETPTRTSGSVGPSGPAANRELIEGVRKQLEDNAALASLPELAIDGVAPV